MRHTIIFWNLGRLFGSAGSPIEYALKADSNATGATAEEVEKKLDVIAAVIDTIASTQGGPPLFVGFTEIENADLAEQVAKRVRTARLRSVDRLAADETAFALDGLNISALVNEQSATVVRMQSHVIDRTFDTRDILEIDLESRGKPWSALVNHWPSRLSGEGRSQRISAAHYVARLVQRKVRYPLLELWDRESSTMDVPSNDALLERSRVPVAVLGDFNDEVFNEAIDALGATPETDEVTDDLHVRGRSKRDRFRTYRGSPFRLLNPFWTFAGSFGSYYRSPRWRTYDQIMLSRGFCEHFEGQILSYEEGSAAIHRDREVTLANGEVWQVTNNNGKPIRFDSARSRGCSDHFPVVVTVDLPDEGS
jgi:endonuclease/exonuclease/phosphatase family metal-dependent hydrolase